MPEVVGSPGPFFADTAGAVVLDGSTATPVLAAHVLAEVDRRFPPAAAAGLSGSAPRV